MSKHSERFLELKQDLNTSEQELRNEIDRESVKLEHSMFGIVKAVGIATAIAGFGYLAFRFASSKPTKKKKKIENIKNAIRQPQTKSSANWTDPIVLMVARNVLDFFLKKIENVNTEKKNG
jgi:hypothetical protein